jgi:hypothetical protein
VITRGWGTEQRLAGFEGNVVAIGPVVVSSDAGSFRVLRILHEQKDVPASQTTQLVNDKARLVRERGERGGTAQVAVLRVNQL